MLGWEMEGRATSTSSSRTNRWTKGMTALGLIVVGLCALRTKFDSDLRRVLKGRNPNSSRVRRGTETSSVERAPIIPVMSGLPLPVFLPRGRGVGPLR